MTNLTAKDALTFVERIERVRREADDGEFTILAELRGMPDYELNQDRDILEVVKLRAEAAARTADAEAILGAFNFTISDSGEIIAKGPA